MHSVSSKSSAQMELWTPPKVSRAHRAFLQVFNNAFPAKSLERREVLSGITRCFTVMPEVSDANERIRTIMKLAASFLQCENLPAAHGLYLECLGKIDVQAVGDRSLRVELFEQVATCCTQSGHTRLATAYRTQSRIEIAQQHRCEGGEFDGKGDWGAAENSYLKAYHIFKECGELHLCTVCGMRLILLREILRDERVVEACDCVMELLEQLGKTIGAFATFYQKIASSYLRQGAWERAAQCYERAATFPVPMELDPCFLPKGVSQAQALDYCVRGIEILGKCFVAADLVEEPLFLNCASAYEFLMGFSGEDTKRGECFWRLGNLYFAHDRLDEAKRCYEQGKVLLSPHSFEGIRCLISLAQTGFALGDPVSPHLYCTVARESLANLQNPVEQARGYLELAYVYRSVKQRQLAIEYYQKAIECYQKAIGSYQTAGAEQHSGAIRLCELLISDLTPRGR